MRHAKPEAAAHTMATQAIPSIPSMKGCFPLRHHEAAFRTMPHADSRATCIIKRILMFCETRGIPAAMFGTRLKTCSAHTKPKPTDTARTSDRRTPETRKGRGITHCRPAGRSLSTMAEATSTPIAKRCSRSKRLPSRHLMNTAVDAMSRFAMNRKQASPMNPTTPASTSRRDPKMTPTREMSATSHSHARDGLDMKRQQPPPRSHPTATISFRASVQNSKAATSKRTFRSMSLAAEPASARAEPAQTKTSRMLSCAAQPQREGSFAPGSSETPPSSDFWPPSPSSDSSLLSVSPDSSLLLSVSSGSVSFSSASLASSPLRQ
mmetsp:Transcript_60098/g.169495  ORF Transcript_60098/g.169495 Transcript_60098/m.169495 type:complete len:322 (-) Transcript_60098:795-1760(-)